MNFKKSLKNSLLIGICLIVIGFAVFSRKKSPVIKATPTPTAVPIPPQHATAKVARVYDGDTIQLEGGLKVRYIGIDAAEVYPEAQCFSKEAKRENENLVLGKEITIVSDISDTDKYGRLLGYVYVGDKFVNNELVKSGFAKVITVPPDIKYKDEFVESENYAKENNLGLWRNCF